MRNRWRDRPLLSVMILAILLITSRSYTAERHQDNRLRSRVVNSRGESVRDAQVFALSTPLCPIHLRSGSIPEVAGSSPIRTAKDGSFQVPPTTSMVAAFHEMGYCVASIQRFDQPLVLQPWGAIEGRARAGDWPVALEQIIIDSKSEVGPTLIIRGYVRTDADGAFRLSHVPAATYLVGRVAWAYTGFGHAERTKGAEYVDVAAGQTASVQIGGRGRTVIAQLAIPTDLGYRYGDAVLRLPDRKNGYWAPVVDGCAIIEDVPPGDYILQIKLYKCGEKRILWRAPVGVASHEVKVTEVAPGERLEPFVMSKVRVRKTEK